MSLGITARTKKYDDIVSSARALFWKHGVRRISVEEICQQAGVSKMTFYRFFPNKIELAKAVFEREVYLGVQRFRDILKNDSSPSEKIKSVVRLKLESTDNISREFLDDFYGSQDPDLKHYIEQRTSAAWNDMLHDFRDAQARGIFRQDFNPEFLLLLSQKMAAIVTDQKLSELYRTPTDLLTELTNFIAYGISPRPDEKAFQTGKKKNIGS